MGAIIGAASLIFSAGSFLYQQRQRRKARDRARDAAAVEIRDTPSGKPLPKLYGRTGTQAIPIFTDAASSFRTAGNRLSGTLQTGSGKHNEYLLVQYDVAAGDIDAILDVWIANQSTRTGKLAPVTFLEQGRPGTASAMATAFSSKRDASAKFTGVSYLTGVFRLNRDDPQFFGVPDAFVFARGQKVRAIERSGTPGNYTYTLAAPAYSPNWALCLLDYLLTPVIDAGPGLNWDTDFNQAAFYHAQQVCGATVQGAASSLWTQPYPAPRNVLGGTSFNNWSDYFGALDFTSINDEGYVDSALQPAGAHAEILRHEFNGRVQLTFDYFSVTDLFEEALPGSQIYWNRDGKVDVALPDPTRTAAAQSVQVIDEDVLIVPPEEIPPAKNEKLNGLTVKFANANKDLAEDSVTFPEAGSDLASAWRAEDGGEALHQTETLEGVNNPAHARSIAATTALALRRKRYRLYCNRRVYQRNLGHVVTVRHALSGVDFVARVDRLEIGEDEIIELGVTAFEPSDWEYWGAPKESAVTPPAFTDDVGAVQSVTVTNADGLLTIGYVPNANEDANVIGYEIELFRTASNG